MCPFIAIEMETVKTEKEEKLVAKIKEALCQGCGSCVVACPTGSIKMRHFTKEQILAQINALSIEKEAPA